MKKIYILTIGYPYGKSEPFLQDEIEYYEDVTIVSSYIGDIASQIFRWSEETTNKLIHSDSSFFKGKKSALYLSAVCALFSPMFWKEIVAEDIRPINAKKVFQLLSCISKAQQIIKTVEKKKLFKEDETPIFYAYWMNQLALAAVILAKKHNGFAVSRCHGYDLYKRAENNQYVTFQRFLTHNLDNIFPISQNGKNVLCKLFCGGESKQKIKVSRLGTRDYGIGPRTRTSEYFTVVSCSNVVPLKRVGLIMDAVQAISDLPIRWIHFGDGPLFNEISDKATKIFSGSSHDIQLRGYIQKSEIMKFYAENHVDLFINVSESEGIPVSIMEAQSFGIPCIGTNVGGMHEIIKPENGWLVDVDINSTELAKLIVSISRLEDTQYQNYRKNARRFWEQNFCADVNYKQFIEELKNI